MTHHVTFLPGDGIGPEVLGAARRVVDATGVGVEWAEPAITGKGRHTRPEVEGLLESMRRTRVALKGPTESPPPGSGARSLHVLVRQALDLYAQIRPSRTIPGLRGAVEGVDLVVFRENTEDIYHGPDHEVEPGLRCEALKVITRRASERIARAAFTYAHRHGRRKVSAVTKHDLLRHTDGLFAAVAREVAKDFPAITFEDRLVDNICVDLVRRPQTCDVLVCPNQYGDIVSGVAAGLIGGLGVAPGANHSDHAAVFEPTHGIALRLAGKDRANPTAAILSGALLLRHLGEARAAGRIEDAVHRVIRQGDHVTYDLHPPGRGTAASTREMTDAILKSLE